MLIIVQKVLSISAALLVLASPLAVGTGIFMVDDIFTKNTNVVQQENNSINLEYKTPNIHPNDIFLSPKNLTQNSTINNSNTRKSLPTSQQKIQNQQNNNKTTNENDVFRQGLTDKANKLSQYRIDYYNSWYLLRQIMRYGHNNNAPYSYMQACNKRFSSKDYDLTFDITVKINNRVTGLEACLPFKSINKGKYAQHPILLPENTSYKDWENTEFHGKKVEYKGFILNVPQSIKFFIPNSMTSVTFKTYKNAIWNGYQETDNNTQKTENVVGYNNIVNTLRNIGKNIIKYSKNIKSTHQEIAKHIRANNHLVIDSEQVAKEWENLNY